MEETIAALSTPPGEGAIAVIRISGSRAFQIAEAIFRGKSAIRHRVAGFGRIVDGNGPVDDVVLTTFQAPASYTGEDVVEISCHGGVLVAARVLQTVLDQGAKAAGPGEFTQRAFLNGKMDLTQAEAVMDLIRAQTPLAARAATEQLEGRIGREIREITDAILNVVAHLEACIDFPEEDILPETGELLLGRIAETRARIQSLLATAHEGRILREGVRLAICGKPNAGKSSLLNRLIGFERAIVSPTPGTTRDTIEEFINLRGIPFRIVDTAGLRHTEDAVEREGIERARTAVERADIVLHIVDSADFDAVIPVVDGEILAFNKCDLARPVAVHPQPLFISCTTGEGIETLVDTLVVKVRDSGAPPRESAAAINARHQSCLKRADESLARATNALDSGSEPEFAAIDLRLALDAVGEVVGAIDTEDILGRIFSTFCIGK